MFVFGTVSLFFNCNLLTYFAILIIVRSVYYHLRENIKTLTEKEEDEKEQQWVTANGKWLQPALIKCEGGDKRTAVTLLRKVKRPAITHTAQWEVKRPTIILQRNTKDNPSPKQCYERTRQEVNHHYWAIQRSWLASVHALCNLSRKKSREVAAHFLADFWVGVASRSL